MTATIFYVSYVIGLGIAVFIGYKLGNREMKAFNDGYMCGYADGKEDAK